MNILKIFVGILFVVWSSPALSQVNTAKNKTTSKTSTVPGSTAKDTRIVAKKEYDKGKMLTEKGDFIKAKAHFEQALDQMRRPIILYAAAQCRKDLGDDIEALYLFKEALKANASTSQSFEDKDRLTDIQSEAAFRNMQDLLKRYVKLKIVAPKGDEIQRLSINGNEWTTVRISAQPEYVDGHTNGHTEEIDVFIGLNQPRLQKFQEKTSTETSSLESFLIKPAKYNIEVFLASGRTIYLKEHAVQARSNFLDLRKTSWPSRVVIEEIPPDTHVFFKRVGDGAKLATMPPQKDRKRDVEIPRLSPGKYELIATRKGYLNIEKVITLEVGQRKTEYLDFKQKPLYQKWQFWVSVGMVSAAIVGITVPLIRSNKKDPPGSGTVNLESQAIVPVRF